MKKTFLSALLLATALTTGGAKAETIFEALSTAYDTNPTLQAQRAYLRSVDENVAIAKSGFRPNIYLTGGYSDSDVHNNNVPSQTGGATLSAGAKISQPVFSRTFQVFLQAAGEDEPSVLHWLIVNQPIQL